jgi:hypothetical protein
LVPSGISVAAIDRSCKFAFVKPVDKAYRVIASAFLTDLM